MIRSSASASRLVWPVGSEPQFMTMLSPGYGALTVRTLTVCAVAPPLMPFQPRTSTLQRSGTCPAASIARIGGVAGAERERNSDLGSAPVTV